MTSEEIDARMAAVLKNVRAGKWVEDTWDLFRVHYFRGASDEEAVKLLRAWCDRHNLECGVRMGRTDVAGRTFYVVHIRLMPA